MDEIQDEMSLTHVVLMPLALQLNRSDCVLPQCDHKRTEHEKVRIFTYNLRDLISNEYNI